MSRYLLLVTLGPVQDFIAAARRTRDLWYGSHLLSELGRAAARELVNGGAALVFPALVKGDLELEACPSPLRASGVQPLSVANKLIAELPPDVEPEPLARAVRAAVMKFWEKAAADVKARCSGLVASGTEDVWNEQIDTSIEFAAAWAPLENGYAGALAEAEEVIAGRKNLRDFEPWRKLRGAVPKSSLDGARETVLRRPSERDAALAKKYRIGDGEQLDAVGLLKRAGGDPDQFVPVVNVALAPWLAFAKEAVPQEFGTFEKAARTAGLAPVRRTDLPCGRVFAADASVLLPSRWDSIFKEQKLTGDPQAWGRNNVQPLLDCISEPYPYVVCLVADGDRVGRAIQGLGSAGAHRVFSRALSSFAGEARKIVEQEHLGALVYSGGDDVLAFLPLAEAVPCADALRRRFLELMSEACADLAPRDRPTISIGLGVGHVIESMGDLLALGREAEQFAKRGGAAGGDRNALSVVLDKRSGDTLRWRARWDEWEGDPPARLLADAELLSSTLSSKKVYEIAALLARLPPSGSHLSAGWSTVLVREIDRALSRTHAGEVALRSVDVGLRLEGAHDYAPLHADVAAWVKRLLIASVFAKSVPKLRRKEALL
jgi:CRISPR-associated protein Cmr2